jgi:hypothetical protein
MRWTVRLVCWLALPVGAFLVAVNGAPAQGSDEARQACTPDAMRLCSEFVPDVPRITACMNAKHAQLSIECRRAMSHGHRVYKHRTHRGKSYRHCGHGRHCG